MSEAVLVLDDEEQVTWANPAAVALFGYDLGELQGRPISDLLAEEDLLVLTGLRCAFADNAASDLNILFRSRDGTLMPTTTSGKLVSDEVSGRSSLILVIRDERRMYNLLTQASKEIVTERERLSQASEALRVAIEKRKQAEVELRHAQKLKAVGQLAAGIAHEINTPVQFVSDSVTFLQEAFADLCGIVDSYSALMDAVAAGLSAERLVGTIRAAEVERDLPYIRMEAPAAFQRTLEGLQRVSSIIRAMGDFAHPLAAERSEVDLNSVVTNALTVVRNEYRLVADVETALGDLPRLFCSRGEIAQVIINLVVNAAHAIGDVVERTETRGTIRVTTELDGPMACIAVSDTGTGIPDDIKDRIFEPFFTTKEVGKGTGQGLAITRSIVQRHGGTISVDSTPGQGTRFFVRLPINELVDNP